MIHFLYNFIVWDIINQARKDLNELFMNVVITNILSKYLEVLRIRPGK